MQNAGLIEKIQKLPPETRVEVEHFIDFLMGKQNGCQSETSNGNKTEVVNLRECGISEKEAAAQRAALDSFAEDWELSEMEVYDKL
ncbi:MAG: DUF2281 domain-containing protein [Pyrinomonadaceae bacterium]